MNPHPYTLTLFVTVAGCLQADPGAAPPGLEDLAGLTACEFQYPDGSPIPCEGMLPLLDTGSGLPDGAWVCSHAERPDRADFRFHRDATRDDAVVVEVRHEASHMLEMKLILLDPEGERHYAVARVPPAGAFFERPLPPGPVDGLWLALIAVTVSTDIEALHAVEYQPLWSVFGKSFFLVHRLVADDVYHMHGHLASIGTSQLSQPWQGYSSVEAQVAAGAALAEWPSGRT